MTAQPGDSRSAGSAEATRDQFRSVIYLRGAHPYFPEGREVARAIRPHTFVHPQFWGDVAGVEATRRGLAEARGWGVCSVGGWGPVHPSFIVDEAYYPGLKRGDVPAVLVPDTMPPVRDDQAMTGLDAFTLFHWDHWKARGELTGEKPADIRDWLIVTEAEARAQRAGSLLDLHEREVAPFLMTERSLPVSMFNPDVIRFFCDVIRDRVRRGHYPDADLALDFMDIAGSSGLDFSEHARQAFEQMVREAYTREEIAELFACAADQPIPLLPPDGASEDLERTYRIERTKLFTLAYGRFYGALREAVREVSGGRMDLKMIKNGACFSWHAYGNSQGIYPLYWGRALTTYMSEGGNWPGTGMRRSCTGLRFADVEQNIFDYMYGNGRLWGEPVVLKNFYHRVRNPFVAQLAVAEGMAMLGNAGLYAKVGDARSKARGTEVDYRWPLPMVRFAHHLTSRLRQMIPAAEVAIVYSSVDRMAEFTEHIENTFELCDMLAKQHVPFQFVHLELLAETLEARGPRVLILPWLRGLTDAQTAVLAAHVRGGGALIGIGPCGTHNGGRQRAEPALRALLAPPDGDGLGVRTVGRGRTVCVDGLLAGYDPGAHVRLRKALWHACGRDPSAAPPRRETAALFFNLTRNSNRSRHWLHALNYDVDLLDWGCGETRALSPGRALDVSVALPEGVRATAVRLLRPELPDEEIPFTETAAGCALTLPWLDLYAVIEMDTAPGVRPGQASPPDRAASEAEIQALLSATAWRGEWRRVAAPSAPASAATDGPTRLTYGTRAYAQVGAGCRIEMQLWVSAASPGDRHRHPLSVIVHDAAGAPVGSGIWPPGDHQAVIPVPAPGVYALTFRAGQRWPSGSNVYAVRFTHAGGAVFEASAGMPFSTCGFTPRTPFYFWMPKETRVFDVHVHTPLPTKTRLKPSRITVRDAAGAIMLDDDGAAGGTPTFIGEGFDYHDRIAVPPGQAGQIWSVELWGAPGSGGDREDTRFSLDGVPPLLAETPGQLMIPL